jgi:uncharacterized protein YutE (UPF0331/DUF86 family)
MLDKNLIYRKLRRIVGFLKELEPLGKESFDKYTSDYLTKHASERLIELIVESAIDINTLLLVENSQSPPQDYYSSFYDLVKLNIYPRGFADRIAWTAGLRNRLAHEYEEIQDRKVYKAMKELAPIYKTYIAHIETFIEAKPRK